MKRWKADTKNWEVREVEANEWPGIDSEGDICYDATHHETKEKAIAFLVSESEAWIKVCGYAMTRALDQVKQAQKDAGDAAVAYVKSLKLQEDCQMKDST